MLPPVKSTDRFSPRMKNSTSELMTRTIDSVYQIRRVAMKGKLVALPKNSTWVPSSSADRQLGRLVRAAVYQGQQRAAAKHGREHRRGDAHHQHRREVAYGTGAEYPQDHAGNGRGDVGVPDRRPGLLETGADGGLRRHAIAQLLAHTLVDDDVGVHRHADGQQDAGDA